MEWVSVDNAIRDLTLRSRAEQLEDALLVLQTGMEWRVFNAANPPIMKFMDRLLMKGNAAKPSKDFPQLL